MTAAPPQPSHPEPAGRYFRRSAGDGLDDRFVMVMTDGSFTAYTYPSRAAACEAWGLIEVADEAR